MSEQYGFRCLECTEAEQRVHDDSQYVAIDFVDLGEALEHLKAEPLHTVVVVKAP